MVDVMKIMATSFKRGHSGERTETLKRKRLRIFGSELVPQVRERVLKQEGFLCTEKVPFRQTHGIVVESWKIGQSRSLEGIKERKINFLACKEFTDCGPNQTTGSGNGEKPRGKEGGLKSQNKNTQTPRHSGQTVRCIKCTQAWQNIRQPGEQRQVHTSPMT